MSDTLTRLERFIKHNGLRPAQLAREAGISRAHLLRMRKGTMEPTRLMMIWIAAACARILGRRVRVRDVFDLAVRTAWRRKTKP